MGNPTTAPDPFETSANSLSGQSMTRGQFIAGLTALLATKASDVFSQTPLPRTYDEIMAALDRKELTYEQLFKACSDNANNFTETQKTALKGELAKLKMVKERAGSPVNERPEDKQKRLEEERKAEEAAKMTRNINKAFFDKKNWVTAHKKDVVVVDIGKEKVGMQFVSKETNINRADLCLINPAPLSEGDYQIDIDYSGTGVVGFWSYDHLKKPISVNGNDRTFLQNGTNNVSLPKGTTSVKFFLATSPSDKNIEVTKFNINKVNAGTKMAMGN